MRGVSVPPPEYTEEQQRFKYDSRNDREGICDDTALQWFNTASHEELDQRVKIAEQLQLDLQTSNTAEEIDRAYTRSSNAMRQMRIELGAARQRKKKQRRFIESNNIPASADDDDYDDGNSRQNSEALRKFFENAHALDLTATLETSQQSTLHTTHQSKETEEEERIRTAQLAECLRYRNATSFEELDRRHANYEQLRAEVEHAWTMEESDAANR